MLDFLEEYLTEFLIALAVLFLRLTGNKDKAEKLKAKIKKQEKKVEKDLVKSQKDMTKLEELKKEV